MPAFTHGARRLALLALLSWSISCASAAPQNVAKAPSRPEPSPPATLRLAEAGRTRLVVRVPGRVLVEPGADELEAAVDDLAHYLGRIIGTTVAVEPGSPADGDGRWPILVGELGQERFGPVQRHSPGAQTFRVVARDDAIALYGESDLATSYAIYELLLRLGCRWYMPGELGEVVPPRPTLELAPLDLERAPDTLYRGIWYADADYKRRNRLGGLKLAAGHRLERWISDAQREEHPEWRAQIGGAPHASRLRWSNPQLADAIAESIDAHLAKQPADSVSMSPGDGLSFDEGDDRALDAGDFDRSVNGISLTDRLMVLVNRVAEKLSSRHPELLLGVLAYASYTRPPVRETVHPNVVPVIAPITYCRTRPWSDSRCPGADDVRELVAGWRARARLVAFRGYVFNLAEPSAPNPMLRKWSEDMAFLMAHDVAFYQPESLPTFETNLPALYLGLRMSFDRQLSAAALLDELFRDFYGSAGAAVRAYSELIDQAWLSSTDFAGGNLAYASRFPPELLGEARRLMELAKGACRTPEEQARVAMLDASLAQLERYMGVITQLRTGELHDIGANYQRWLDEAIRLSEQYASNSAFGKVRWAGSVGAHASYGDRFLGPMVREAERLVREEELLTPVPLCHFTYATVDDASAAAPAAPPASRTDVCTETWSRLGLHDYFGAVRYELSLPRLPARRGKIHLWLSRVDGVASVWLNGRRAAPVGRAADEPATNEAHLAPLTFDLSQLLAPASNELVIVVQRTHLSELGGGGLLGPVYLYRDR